GDVVRGADPLERLGQGGGVVLADPLHPELEGADRAGRQRFLQPRREVAADVEGRDQVKLRRRTVDRLETRGEIRIQLVFHQASSTTARAKPSHFLLPTVWMAVALSPGVAATASNRRREPWTLASPLSGFATSPSRTTLSTTITVPGR